MNENNVQFVTIDIETAKRLLYSEMSRISEDCYFAGWMMGLEFALWESVNGGSTRYGIGQITDDDIASLKGLSQACGGWYYWEEDASDAAFISLAEWEKIIESELFYEQPQC